jgi:hypothetical protein
VTPVLVSLLAVIAALAWGMAVLSAIRIVRLAPSGSGFITYVRLGWWRFEPIRAELGPAVEPHLASYRNAFIVFFACVIGAIGLSSFHGLPAQN